MIYDVNSIKSQLQDANRDYNNRKTWEGLFSGVDKSVKQQENLLAQDYYKTMAEAYAQAQTNMSAVQNSNIGQGYKLDMLEQNKLALEEAYQSYNNNYLKSLSELESSRDEANTAISTELTKQAEFTKKFADSPYQYLTYLWEKNIDKDTKDNIFYNNEQWQKYTNLNSETGERSLKTWEEIASVGAYDSETGESTGMFDKNGNLTIKGVDFYDQMMNQFANEGTEVSFGQWLSENDSDLYNWATSYNPYNYTEAGTNVGTFKTMVGLSSTDEKYSFIERFGGLTKKEVQGLFDDVMEKSTTLSNMISQDDGSNSKSQVDAYKPMVDEIKGITDRLGITNLVEGEMGMSFDDLSNVMTQISNGTLSKSDINENATFTVIQGALAGATVGAGVGAKIGATVGTAALPGVGTAGGGVGGTVLGAIVGFIGGAATAGAVAADEYEKSKANNREAAKLAEKQFDDMLYVLLKFSESKRQEVQAGNN